MPAQNPQKHLRRQKRRSKRPQPKRPQNPSWKKASILLRTDFVSMYAAIVISIVPSIVGYMIFQKQIVSGLTSGAVKG